MLAYEQFTRFILCVVYLSELILFFSLFSNASLEMSQSFSYDRIIEMAQIISVWELWEIEPQMIQFESNRTAINRFVRRKSSKKKMPSTKTSASVRSKLERIVWCIHFSELGIGYRRQSAPHKIYSHSVIGVAFTVSNYNTIPKATYSMDELSSPLIRFAEANVWNNLFSSHYSGKKI